MKSTKTKLINFLNAEDFGEEVFNDYYGEGNRAGYMIDLKKFNETKTDAANLLSELGKISDEEIKEACERAFCGRLEFDGNNFHYTAGQFYNIEIPQAVLAVAWFIQSARDQENSLN